ncbi:MAG: glycosyltransferase [Cytophagia bacterium]|nr:glycosyltransferase [Cytophagia bacterium]NBW33696.1 glycosyltransferase [Cytophagia bacterium]
MLSLITPTHKPVYLMRLYESIKNQTSKDFEWVIVPNNGADVSFIPAESWIRIVPYNEDSKLIGAVKNFAFKQGLGEWLAEVDHDDELLPNCVEEVIKAIKENPDCNFIFSDSMEVDKNDNSVPYGSEFGWRHYNFDYNGKTYIINKSYPATPQSVSRIWFAPNHIRVWEKDFYYRLGGHNVTLKALDDQELMCRTYVEGKMHQINTVLYRYHMHGNNSFASQELNSWIQEYTMVLYDQYITPMMEKWCDMKGLMKLDLCGGHNPPKGYISIDLEKSDIVHNLDVAPWPVPDNSVGIVRASDALEHLKDKVQTMKEIHRILAPGGMLLSHTPSTDGRGAFQDPTHVAFWNSNSFWYYTKAQTAAYINKPVRFQLTRIKNWFPSDWHKLHEITYVTAHLTALKGGDEWSYAPGKIEI